MKLKKQIAEHKGELPELEIDTETGLPKLPEGFAWKVKKADYRGDSLEVQIVAKKTVTYNFLEKIFLGESDSEDYEFYGHSFEGKYDYTQGVSKESILTTATAIYNELREEVNTKFTGSEFEGIYPPKSIL